MTKCALCNCEIGFDEDWTDEDAKKEYRENFPDDPNMEVPTDTICGDCYNGSSGFKSWFDNLSPEYREQMKKEMMRDV